MEDASVRDAMRVLRYNWDGKPTGHTTGRPRRRLHVGDFPSRIDADAIRRRAIGEGHDLSRVAWVELTRTADGEALADTVAVASVPDRRYGWRLWLICPGCGTRRAHLYATGRGIGCRRCMRILYPDRPARA
jgi:hypothetical protein